MYLYFKKIIKEKILDIVSSNVYASLNSISNLLDYLENVIKYENYDIIIDGANVGFYNSDKIFSFDDIYFVYKNLVENNFKPLIVLHNRHFRNIKTPLDLPIFKTPDRFNDDHFWLFCCFTLNCKLLTNDKMRDHINETFKGDEKVFEIWKKDNVCKFNIHCINFVDDYLQICKVDRQLKYVKFENINSKFICADKRYFYNYDKSDKEIVHKMEDNVNKKIENIKNEKKNSINSLQIENPQYLLEKSNLCKYYNSEISKSVVDLINVTCDVISDNIINESIAKINKVKRGDWELEGETILFVPRNKLK